MSSEQNSDTVAARFKVRATLTIRPMISADAPAILAINAICRPAVAGIDLADLRRLDRVGATGWVACDASEVVGYLLAFSSTSDYDGEEYLSFRGAISVPFLYVAQIAIAASHRRFGAGKKLYATALRRARKDGASLVCCEVNLEPPNPESLAFHRTLGFQRFGDLRLADGYLVTLLTLRLA